MLFFYYLYLINNLFHFHYFHLFCRSFYKLTEFILLIFNLIFFIRLLFILFFILFCTFLFHFLLFILIRIFNLLLNLFLLCFNDFFLDCYHSFCWHKIFIYERIITYKQITCNHWMFFCSILVILITLYSHILYQLLKSFICHTMLRNLYYSCTLLVADLNSEMNKSSSSITAKLS